MSRPLSRVWPVLLLALGLATACTKDDKKLKVTGLEPNYGDLLGGSFVTVHGNRFLDDGPRIVKVFFGNRQGTVVRFMDDDTLIVQAPGGKPDETVDVVILFEPGGKIRIDKGFTYKDTSADKLGVEKLDTTTVDKK